MKMRLILKIPILCCALGGLSLISPQIAAGAQADKQTDAASVHTLPPSREEVFDMIQLLDSVRDYERLQWILSAIDAQETPVRGELIQQLDDRVQLLLGATVIPTTHTAAETETTQDMPITESNEMRIPFSSEPQLERIEPSAEERSFESVKWEVERLTLQSDPEENINKINEISRHIAAIKNSQQRVELYDLLRQQTSRRQVYEPYGGAGSSESAFVE